MRPLFKDDTFDFLARIALGSASARCADVGEVFATLDGLRDGDADGWVQRWSATARRLEAEAIARRDAGHDRSAAAAFLRAAKYYETATYQAYAAKGPNPFLALWEDYRRCWELFLALSGLDVERVAIPYDGTTLPGFFLRAGAGRRRTLVFNNGSDGSMVDAWGGCALDGLARGWNVLLFDGPGQGAALVRQGLFFRPDWEAVVTPVVDMLVARDDVDPARLAIMGVSQGGYWVPRALAYEHRLAAGVADPGVVDVSATMTAHLPGSMVRLLASGEREAFDRDVRRWTRLSRKASAQMAFRFRPYGLDSPFDVYRRAMESRLSDEEIARIRTPLLVTAPEDERFWPGQSAALYAKLPGRKALMEFTAAEGADLHCEPMAGCLRGERVFDWLDEVVPADAAEAPGRPA
jgi:hypothetical protein